MSELVGYHNGRFWLRHMIGCHGLRSLQKFDGILMYQHFKFSSKMPGKVDCYKTLKSIPVDKTLLKDKEKDMISYLTTYFATWWAWWRTPDVSLQSHQRILQTRHIWLCGTKNKKIKKFWITKNGFF